LQSLLTSAEDFLGKVERAVITVPAWWGAEQRVALEAAAKDAGIPVIQLLEEAAAATSTTTSAAWVGGDDYQIPLLLPDRTQLIVDVGSTSTSFNLLSIRESLTYDLASSYHPNLGSTQIDDKLIKHFAAELKEAITDAQGTVNNVKATLRTLGLLFPNSEEEHAELGGVFVPVIQKETALPARRIITLEVGLPTAEPRRVAFEVWEAKEGIRVEKIKIEVEPLSDDEDEPQEDEYEEVKHKIISKEILLGALEFQSTLGLQAKGGSKSTANQVGGWTTTVQVQFVVGIGGELDVEVKEVGASAEEGVQAGSVRLHVPALLA
jgi:molecular chaperone DnaK (HSP70)